MEMKRLPIDLLLLALALPLAAAQAEPQRIACNVSVFTRAERTRHLELIAMLKSKVAEMREVPGGYAFRYPAELIHPLAEFALLESKCCPVIDFQLELEPQPGGPAWLRLLGTGTADVNFNADVQEFIGTEFEPLIAIARAKGQKL
jgi:hypothetical protein